MSTATATPPSIPVSASERRIATRRQPAMGTVLQFDSASGDKSETALVWNISTTGISMLVHEPRQAGVTIHGVLETIYGRHPLPVSMKVVHVKKVETGDYFLGAHFDRPLTLEEMKPFVE